MRLFEYCPDCQQESMKTIDKLPKVNKLGTDGYGQPVRFTDCECGSALKGFFNLDYYDTDVDEDGFRGYLKHRIELYHEVYKIDNKTNILLNKIVALRKNR